MVDIVSPEKRSKMMSNIQGKNTKPEILIRKNLYSKGYRYKLHVKSLQGKPDIVLSKYNALIFINGCFWHKHNCHLFKWPKTRRFFWETKINKNIENDQKNHIKLLNENWRILIVWECSIKGKTKKTMEIVINDIVEWLHSDINFKEIEGNNGNS